MDPAAFAEPLSGRSLLKLIERPQPWSVVRDRLLDLAHELNASTKDGTLPPTLRLDRVWVTAAGRVKLLNFSAPGRSPTRETPESGPPDQPASEAAAYLL